MPTVQAFTIRAGDYGQELDFYLLDENGAVYVIPEAATVTFECRLDGAAELFIGDTAHVTIVDDDAGHVRYTVQDGDFEAEDAGVYFARMRVNNITSGEVPMTVLEDQELPA